MSVRRRSVARPCDRARHVNVVRNFANQIFSGKLNDDWPMWALKTQKVLDACLESARNGSR